MDVRWNNRRNEIVCKKEWFITQYSVFIFLKILLRYSHVEWCLKFVDFLRDIMVDDKNNDWIFWGKDGGKEEKINMNVFFIRINLNLIHRAQIYVERKLIKIWYWWRSRDELISDVLLWTPTYGRAKAGRAARTYIQQLCEDTGCSPEDLPEAMNDWEKWRERVRDICATSTTWWWWWWWWWWWYVLAIQN